MKNRTVSNLNFKGREDGEVLRLAMDYTCLRPGLTLKAAIRNYLLESLPTEIARLAATKRGMAS